MILGWKQRKITNFVLQWVFSWQLTQDIFYFRFISDHAVKLDSFDFIRKWLYYLLESVAFHSVCHEKRTELKSATNTMIVFCWIRSFILHDLHTGSFRWTILTDYRWIKTYILMWRSFHDYCLQKKLLRWVYLERGALKANSIILW